MCYRLATASYFFLDKKVTKNQGLQSATLRSTAEPLWPAERNRSEAIRLQLAVLLVVIIMQQRKGIAAQRSSRASPARGSTLERYGCTLNAGECGECG